MAGLNVRASVGIRLDVCLLRLSCSIWVTLVFVCLFLTSYRSVDLCVHALVLRSMVDMCTWGISQGWVRFLVAFTKLVLG